MPCGVLTKMLSRVNSQEMESLSKEFSDKSRKVKISKGKALVPVKFDEKGELLTLATFDARRDIKQLSLDDLRFLQAWRKVDWDIVKVLELTGIPGDKAKRLISRLQVFRDEDAQVKALSEIPTPAWIQAKHVENVYTGNLQDSERDSLKELSKMSGAYKTQATVNIQTNIFQMPQLPAAAMAKLKEFADSQADVQEGEVA